MRDFRSRDGKLHQERLQIGHGERRITLPEEGRLCAVVPRRLCPTPGRCCATSMPARVNSRSSPMPDCISTFGVLMDRAKGRSRSEP